MKDVQKEEEIKCHLNASSKFYHNPSRVPIIHIKNSFSRYRNIIKYPRAILRILFVIVNNIYCIPTYLIWMFLLLPLRKLHIDTFYWIEGKLFHWLLANVTLWSHSAGYESEFYFFSKIC